jgi:cyanophycinase-like exopeptidase
VSGPIALHGGGEFQSGDEPVLTELLRLAARRVGDDQAIRIALVPAAAAEWDPADSADQGVAAFQRVAGVIGLAVLAEPVMIVDAASAASEQLAKRIEDSDIVYLPGGDPGRLVSTLRGSRALQALTAVHDAGGILAGASAGAMALAAWTWAPNGKVDGLGFIPDLLVVPHADESRWSSEATRLARHAPRGYGVLGLAERTAAIAVDPDAHPLQWHVVGTGDARWVGSAGGVPVIVHPGETFETSSGWRA